MLMAVSCAKHLTVESHTVIMLLTFILIIPAKAFARDYVIIGVGLSVFLSVCLFVTTITK